MLYELNSEVVEKKQEGELGLDSALSCNGRGSAATNYHSNQSVDEHISQCLKTQSDKNSQIKQLQIRKLMDKIRVLSQKQTEMESTFQICIQNLETQINYREKSNMVLREEICFARSDLGQTKKDISYIREYLGRKKTSGTQNNQNNMQVSTKLEDKPIRKNRSVKLFKTGLMKIK